MQAQLRAPKPRPSTLTPPRFSAAAAVTDVLGHCLSWMACLGLLTELTDRPSPRAFPLLLFHLFTHAVGLEAMLLFPLAKIGCSLFPSLWSFLFMEEKCKNEGLSV